MNARTSENRSGVEGVLITPELRTRPSRAPDHEAENRALVALAQAMAECPQALLQKLADAALELCRADSAGVSLEEGDVFRWRATAGGLGPFLGATLPRSFSPCGTVIDRNATLLMADPVRDYPCISDLPLPVREVMLIPFYRGDHPIGTVWVVSHTDRRFDAEDERLVTSLSRFAAAAARTISLLNEAEHARTRMQEAESRLRMVVESATDFAIFSLDPEGKVASWNSGAEHVFGWAESEILGRDGSVLFTPEDREAGVPQAEMRKAREEGRAEDERWHVRQDGTRFFSSGVTTPIRDEKLHGYAKVCRDITERMRSGTENQRLLREVETERARLAEVFQLAPSFLCVLRGPEHVFERANDRYFELLDHRDIIGLPARKALPEVEGQGFFEILDRVFATGQPFVGTDMRILLQRGAGLEERVLEFVYQPMRDTDGRVSGILAHGIDLTERKRAEESLARVTAESERQRRMFDTALSHTADFIYLFDHDGRFTYVNRALLDLWGKSLPEAVGKNFFDLDYPVALATRLHRQIQEVIETRRPVRDETPYTSALGTRAYEYIFVPVLGAGGAVEAVAGSTRDITDRKLSEEALRASEQRYRVLVTASADVVYRMNADWSEMYPLDGRDLVASNSNPIRGWMVKNIPAFEHVRLAEAIGRAVTLRQPFEMEHQVIRPDQTLGWTHSRAAPILDDRGEIVEWFGTARDVTDRKRASEELARLAEALGLALAAADLGTWEWDPTSDLMNLSARAAEIYGVDPARPHLREMLRGLLHPDDRDRARETAAQAVRDRADYDIEYRLTRSCSEAVWVAARGRGVFDADGKLIRMNGVVQDITARKRAEAELRDIRSRMETALEAGAIGTWAWDVLTDRFYGDASLARIFSLSPEDVAGGPLSRVVEAIHPDDRDRVTGLVAESVATGCRYEADYRVLEQGSLWRWVTARGQVERDAAGRAVRLPGVVIDVTEKKRAEESLARVTEESERRKRLYETILSATPDFIYVFSLDYRILYANDSLVVMWGAGDPVGRTFLEVGYEPWHAEMHCREIDQVRTTKKPIRGEVPFTGTNGRKIYDYIFVPVFGTDGEVEAVAGTTRDVTERKQAEERLQLAVAIARMGTFEIDLQTDAVEVNEPGREIYGWPDVRTTFAQVQTHFHPDDRDKVMRQVGIACDPEGPGVFEVEQRIIRVDGAVRWIRVRGRVFFNTDGATRKAVRCVGTYLDVTERKEAEEELRQADRKKDDFIALLAHELRNPLAPIRNGLQVLRLASDQLTRDHARDMMDRQLSHMVRLIDDLLDISRINRSKMELRKARVSLAEAVGTALEAARPLIEEAGHELTVSLPSGAVYLDADLTRLAQVFGNLLTNSAKYTPRGGKVWVNVERRGAVAVVAVRDSGIGVPPGALSSIFDMFSQVDRSVERATGGLGIGLALVKGLVEMHGGTVSAHSEGEGKGSTFTVTLPVLADHPERDDHTPGNEPMTERRRILVVDDNRDGADSLALMLRLLGNDVRTANDGLEAVAQAEVFRPEVILMDVGMPRLNGLDAARRIREQRWGKRITIVALTGWGQEGDRERSREAGCDGHLVKPVNLPDLERVLGQARQG